MSLIPDRVSAWKTERDGQQPFRQRAVFRRQSWCAPHHAETMSLNHLDPIGVLCGLLVVLLYRHLRQRHR
jgi:hypothetical protein